MEKRICNPELLAPAGDWQCLKVAAAAGADAVYLGGKFFSARRYAPNFNREELSRAADYLHIRGKKIYIAVNTLIKQEELPAALEYVNYLYSLGTDGVIIQDLGLLILARKLWPDLPLHASTQMTIHDAAGVRFLKKLGVKRVILARENSLTEISAIKHAGGLELEVFVHGALCVSYSGACLFSSMIGGRSGNRGSCTQPCRMEYRLLKNGKKAELSGTCLLSVKDLFLLPYLAELAAAGVTAFKIEGRMKDPEYVGTVVEVYRRAMDRLAEKPGEFRVLLEEEKLPARVFNRGFYSGYLKGDPGPELSAAARPSNRGVFVGRVKSYDHVRRFCRAAVVEKLANGDEIEIWTTKGGRRRTVLKDLSIEDSGGEDKAKACFTLPEPVNPGDRVFLVSSQSVRSRVRELLRNDYTPGKVPCKMSARVAPGEPLVVTLEDYDGHSVTVHSEEAAQTPQRRALTAEILAEHLLRLGEAPFFVKEFIPEITGKVMLPFGLIHRVRRKAVSALAARRLSGSARPPQEAEKLRKVLPGAGPTRFGPSYLVVFAGNLETVLDAAGCGIGKIIFGGESFLPGAKWEKENLIRAVSACRGAGVSPVIAFPRITREREKTHVQTLLEVCRCCRPDGVLVSHPGSFQLLREETDLPIFINYTLPTFNTVAGVFWAKEGVKGFTLSPELSGQEIKSFFTARGFMEIDMELLVFGAVELMVSQFCPAGALAAQRLPTGCDRFCRYDGYELQDRKGITFPLVTDEFCRSHLLNSRDLCLISEIPELKNKRLGLRLDLRYYTPPVTRHLAALFQEALNEETTGLWKKVSAVTGRKTTRGHFYRGVE